MKALLPFVLAFLGLATESWFHPMAKATLWMAREVAHVHQHGMISLGHLNRELQR